MVLWSTNQDATRVVALSGPTDIERLICLFEHVADAEGWQPQGGLRRYRDRSVYFALEVAGEIAGGLQLVSPDPLGRLPCHDLWPEDACGSPQTFYLCVLALSVPVRGSGALFWPLAVEMWRYCVSVGVTKLYFEVTPRVLPLYRRLGWPLIVEGDRRVHWGEECYLCSLGVTEVALSLLQRAAGSAPYRRILAQAFRLSLQSETEDPPPAEAKVSWSSSALLDFTQEV